MGTHRASVHALGHAVNDLIGAEENEKRGQRLSWSVNLVVQHAMAGCPLAWH